MNQKLWNEFLNGGNIAVNCKRVDEAEKFMKLCEKYNIKWSSGENATEDTQWGEFKEKTCYTNMFDDCTGLGYARIKFCENAGIQIVTYTELTGDKEESKKIFTGPELARMMIDGKTKAGMKFISDAEMIYKIVDYDTKQQGVGICQVLYRDNENKMATSGELIYRTFILIEEPKPELFYFNQVTKPELFYFNQVTKCGKKIKMNDWAKFHTLQEALQILAAASDTINITEIVKAFNKKVWEVEV